MQEQIGWSGDTFYIRDINGQPCFIMKGKALSFSQRKSESVNHPPQMHWPNPVLPALQDLSGNPIVNFRREFSLFRKYAVYAGATSDHLLATIRPHTFMGITADIEFTNHDGTRRGE